MFIQLSHAKTKASFLMCPPLHYKISYSINPWMNRENQPNYKLAWKQWVDLYQLIKTLGAQVTLLKPTLNPDQVFSSDAGIVFNNIFFSSTFRFAERQNETSYWMQWFLEQGYQTLSLRKNGGYLEGSGDAFVVRDSLICGTGFRSTLTAAYECAEALALRPEPIKLSDRRFYHLDTCFSKLTDDLALFFPKAFQPESCRRLENLLECFAVPEEEALRFACNIVVIDRDLILPSGCPKTRDLLENLGFRTHEVEMSEFIKAGGASKCLSLKLSNLPQSKSAPIARASCE
ncbi:MAG: arginine deiminase-related protein [Bdellovibrionota bacterium]